ncbi:hypothetical protein [Sagittula stellata]|uniref:Uncharacterized protein n=1 Tax=Sagittula stellata (strain ATCC 700073 / DSM 11524 / E-37) TaxID=388399 RepID=A3K0F7_SAGS3|nr:hypothetical protein [Sagittula stellata]EBA09272.1 hypothetical protein SSE37_23559 [Sagittula stellata E-37]
METLSLNYGKIDGTYNTSERLGGFSDVFGLGTETEVVDGGTAGAAAGNENEYRYVPVRRYFGEDDDGFDFRDNGGDGDAVQLEPVFVTSVQTGGSSGADDYPAGEVEDGPGFDAFGSGDGYFDFG